MDLKYQQSQKKLDAEFRRILRIIKPYIPCIMNNHYLTRYRMWLEKLSQAEEVEKKERNIYLVELCRQIEAGILEEPFAEEPPLGKLPPFRQCYCCLNGQMRHLSQRKMTNNTWSYMLANGNQNLKSLYDSPPPLSTQHLQDPFTSTHRSPASYFLPNNNIEGGAYNPAPTIPLQQPQTLRQNISHFKSPLGNTTQVYQLHPYPYYQRNVDIQPREAAKQEIFMKSSKKKKNHFTKNAEDKQPMIKDDCCSTNKQRQEKQKNYNNAVTATVEETEDNSWCDLTDVSVTTVTMLDSVVGSGDSGRTPRSNHSSYAPVCDKQETGKKLQEIYEGKIAKLMDVIQELKRENAQLNRQVEQCERDLSLRNTKAETSIHNLAGEVQCLKNRLQELIEIKSALKDTSVCVSFDWKNKAEQCQMQVTELQTKNDELRTIIADLESKLNEIESNNARERSALKKKITELHEKEIDILKQVHVQNVTTLENSFNQQMLDLEQKNVELKKKYDNKLAEALKEFHGQLQEKDAEIDRLENLVENQCSRMQKEVYTIRTQIEDSATTKNDNYIEKIVFLQKCISKMNKLYQKSEKEHQKTIAKLKKEIDICDRSRQIQLTTQRAELIANNSSQRQSEIDTIVNNLEERYKILLETQQQHSLITKQNDEKIIDDMRCLLDEHVQ